MTYRIDVFNSSHERVAILHDDILVSANVSAAKAAAPELTISIPANDSKKSFISPAYYVKVYNTESSSYEFSRFKLYQPEIIDSGGELLIKATYHGWITQLSNEFIDAYDTTSTPVLFSTVIAALLAYQINTPVITVGTIQPVNSIALSVESSDIYSALNQIKKTYGGWFEVDASLQLNWYNDATGTPAREIRRSKNLQALTYVPQYNEVVNRVYAYGKGESTARINLTDAGEAEEYIEDADSIALYGTQARKFIDKSITHPVTLLAWAQQLLALHKDPPYQYSVDVANLAEVNGYDYDFESLGLDTRVRIIDDLLDVDVNTSIVSYDLNLLAPEEIGIELSTVRKDVSDLFGDILNQQDIRNSVAAQFSAGQVVVLGTFKVLDWASDGETTIDGGNITANTITAEKVNFAVADSSNIVATINASSEGIQINGALIEITGSTSFASGYDPTSKVASVAGQYDSAASGARVRIFPDANTGIQVVDSSSNNVFLCYVGGTDVGDVIIGDYSGGTGLKWDNSASSFDIKGTLTACSIGSGKTLTVAGSIELTGSADIRVIGTTGTIEFYNAALDTYPSIQLYNVGSAPVLQFRASGADASPKMGLSNDALIFNYSETQSININRQYFFIKMGSSGVEPIQLLGLTGEIKCTKLTASTTVSAATALLLTSTTSDASASNGSIYTTTGSNLHWKDQSGNVHYIAFT